MTIYLVCAYDDAVREVERLNGMVANQELPQLIYDHDWEECQHVVAYNNERDAVREVERLNGMVANQELPQFIYDYEAIEVK